MTVPDVLIWYLTKVHITENLYKSVFVSRVFSVHGDGCDTSTCCDAGLETDNSPKELIIIDEITDEITLDMDSTVDVL